MPSLLKPCFSLVSFSPVFKEKRKKQLGCIKGKALNSLGMAREKERDVKWLPLGTSAPASGVQIIAGLHQEDSWSHRRENKKECQGSRSLNGRNESWSSMGEKGEGRGEGWTPNLPPKNPPEIAAGESQSLVDTRRWTIGVLSHHLDQRSHPNGQPWSAELGDQRKSLERLVQSQ